MEQGYEENGGQIIQAHTAWGFTPETYKQRLARGGTHRHHPTEKHTRAPRAAGLIGLCPAASLLTMKAEYGPTIGCCTLVSPKNASGKD